LKVTAQAYMQLPVYSEFLPTTTAAPVLLASMLPTVLTMLTTTFSPLKERNKTGIAAGPIRLTSSKRVRRGGTTLPLLGRFGEGRAEFVVHIQVYPIRHMNGILVSLPPVSGVVVLPHYPRVGKLNRINTHGVFAGEPAILPTHPGAGGERGVDFTSDGSLLNLLRNITPVVLVGIGKPATVSKVTSSSYSTDRSNAKYAASTQ